jgi:hypothetical protein
LADSRLVRPPATSRPFAVPYPDWDLFFRSYEVCWGADLRSITSLNWQVVDNRDSAIYGSDPMRLTVYSRQVDGTQIPLGMATTGPGDVYSGTTTAVARIDAPRLFWCKGVDANSTLFGPCDDTCWDDTLRAEVFDAGNHHLCATAPGSDGKDLYFLMATYCNSHAQDYQIGLEVWNRDTNSWDQLAGKEDAGTARVPPRSSGVTEVYGKDHLVPTSYKHEIGPHMPVYQFRFVSYAPGDPDGKPSCNAHCGFLIKAPPGGGHTIDQDAP